MSDALIVERAGRVVTLTNNDPPYNRMTLDFMDELEVAIGKIARDDDVGVVVLRGAGDERVPPVVAVAGHDRGQVLRFAVAAVAQELSRLPLSLRLGQPVRGLQERSQIVEVSGHVGVLGP